MKEVIKEVIGGTPAEVLAKIVLAAAAALWANLQVIGMSCFLYFILLMADVVMGVILAQRQGKRFSFHHFVAGPAKKLFLTALMFLSASVVDQLIPNVGWLPDAPLFFGTAAFVCVSALMDVGQKYGALTGSKVVLWIESKLGRFIKVEPDRDA